MRRIRGISRQRRGNDGSFWLSFSDLMSSLLLIIMLIMFYIIYQYFDMYEVTMAQIARQQYDLDEANAALEEQKGKLSEAEEQMIAQQIKLDAAEKGLTDAQAILDQQQKDLEQAKTDLDEKEKELAAQQTELDEAREQIATQQTTLDEQKVQIQQQQDKLDTQQTQIEQLVGMRARIISDLSTELKDNNIAATVDPENGSIVLEANVLFDYSKSKLTDAGKRTIDAFLPVYLSVMFNDEYTEYVSEISIVGYTDSDDDYAKNMTLSLERADSVLQYIMSSECTALSNKQKRAFASVVTVSGRSESDLVYDAYGNEDSDASRRVVFCFRLTDEQMIKQMQTILEADDADSADVSFEISDGE